MPARSRFRVLPLVPRACVRVPVCVCVYLYASVCVSVRQCASARVCLAQTSYGCSCTVVGLRCTAGNLGHSFGMLGLNSEDSGNSSVVALSATHSSRSLSQAKRLEDAGLYSSAFDDIATSFLGDSSLIRRFGNAPPKPFPHLVPHVVSAAAEAGDFLFLCSHNLCATEDSPGEVDDLGADATVRHPTRPPPPRPRPRPRHVLPLSLCSLTEVV